MYLHLFNGSEPVLLSIENSSYKPKLSLTCNQVTVEAELTAADKEKLADFFHLDISESLAELEMAKKLLEDEIENLEDKVEALEDDVSFLSGEERRLERIIEDLEKNTNK